MSICVGLDFETANCSQTSACSLGLAVLEDFHVIETRYWLIQPPTSYFKPEFIEIHGLHWDDVRDAPLFDSVWQELCPYVDGRFLFAHNAGFDMAVLRALLKHYQLHSSGITYFDTLQLSRTAWKQLPRHRLDVLASYMNKEFQHHNALADALMCAEVVMRIASECGVSNAEALARYYSLKVRKL